VSERTLYYRTPCYWTS